MYGTGIGRKQECRKEKTGWDVPVKGGALPPWRRYQGRRGGKRQSAGGERPSVDGVLRRPGPDNKNLCDKPM